MNFLKKNIVGAVGLLGLYALLLGGLSAAAHAQTSSDLKITVTQKNGKCETDSEITVNVSCTNPIYTISKTEFKFYNEATNEEIFALSATDNTAHGLPSGTFRVDIRILFSNGKLLKETRRGITVKSTYERPTITVSEYRPTLKGYKSPTGILEAVIKNGSHEQYTVTLLSTPAAYKGDKKFTAKKNATLKIGGLPAGDYEVQANDACITYPKMKVTVGTTSSELPTSIGDNDCVPVRTNCGWYNIWSITSSSTNSYNYSMDTIAKYFDVAFASEEEFKRVGAAGLKWHNLKEMPKSIDDNNDVAYDKTRGYSGLCFKIHDTWYNNARLPREKKPQLYMRQRGNNNYVKAYSLDFFKYQWFSFTPTYPKTDDPCVLPEERTKIRMIDSYQTDFCPPLNIEVKRGNTSIATTTLTLDKKEDYVNIQYQANDVLTFIATDKNGDKYTTTLSFRDPSVYTNTPSSYSYDYCAGARNLDRYYLYTSYLSNTLSPYEKSFKNFKVKLKSAPSDYVPIEGSMKVGETRVVTESGNFYPFKKGQQLFKAGQFVFEITTPCGTKLPDHTMSVSDMHRYSQGEAFEPTTDIPECGYLRIYPFPDGLKNIFLIDGKPLNKTTYLSVKLNYSKAGLTSSSITSFNGSSTSKGNDYIYFKAENAAKVYFQIPLTKGEVSMRVYPSDHAQVDSYTTTSDCLPNTTLKLEEANISYRRSNYIGYACPNGMSGYISFVPLNYVSNIDIELRPAGGGEPVWSKKNASIKKGDRVEINLKSKDGKTPIDTKYLLYLKDNICQNDNKNGVPVALGDMSNYSIVLTTQRKVKYCEGEPIKLECISLGGKESKVEYEWVLPNGERHKGQIYDINKSETKKHSGKYKLIVRNVICEGAPTTVEIEFDLSVAPPEMWWSSDTKNANWMDTNNWRDKDGNKIAAVPAACTTVHIPSTVDTYFPDLDPNVSDQNYWGNAECDNIYFHYGSQLGRPQLLSYNRAYVDYNFGIVNGSGAPQAYQRPNHKGSDDVLLKRDHWYVLSVPLKNVVSGDFGLAGYPKTYQKHLKIDHNDNNSLTSASFTTPMNTMKEKLSAYDNSIALKIVGMHAGVVGESDHKHLNGLNGIIEIPFFLNRSVDAFYPLHHYEGAANQTTASGTSIFQYFNEETLKPVPRKDKVRRSEENFRFIFEPEGQKQIGSIVVNGNAVEGFALKFSPLVKSKYRMVGNPFMTSIDFDQLYEVNKDKIEPYYYVYIDDTWKVYHKDAGSTSNTLTKAIPALQAFVIKTKSAGDLLFPTSEKNNVLLPPNKQTVLREEMAERASQIDHMLIDVTAKNSNGESEHALLLPTAEIASAPALAFQGEVRKPVIFFIDSVGATPNAIHSSHNRAIVPMGVYSESDDIIRLQFDIRNANAFDKLSLYDRTTGKEQDLLAAPSYEYRHSAMEGGGCRFELRMDYPGVSADLATDNLDISVSVHHGSNGYTISSNLGIAHYALYTLDGALIREETIPSGKTELLLTPDIVSSHSVLLLHFIDGSSKTIKLTAH